MAFRQGEAMSSDEDNGIKIEVVSVYLHDNIAEVYITMQDLTEQHRVDATMDLFDSYSINRPFDSTAHCKFVGWITKSLWAVVKNLLHLLQQHL